jgi:hypothetical protein
MIPPIGGTKGQVWLAILEYDGSLFSVDNDSGNLFTVE